MDFSVVHCGKVEDIHTKKHPNGYVIYLGEKAIGLAMNAGSYGGWWAITYADPGRGIRGLKKLRFAIEHMLRASRIGGWCFNATEEYEYATGQRPCGCGGNSADPSNVSERI